MRLLTAAAWSYVLSTRTHQKNAVECLQSKTLIPRDNQRPRQSGTGQWQPQHQSPPTLGMNSKVIHRCGYATLKTGRVRGIGHYYAFAGVRYGAQPSKPGPCGCCSSFTAMICNTRQNHRSNNAPWRDRTSWRLTRCHMLEHERSRTIAGFLSCGREAGGDDRDSASVLPRPAAVVFELAWDEKAEAATGVDGAIQKLLVSWSMEAAKDHFDAAIMTDYNFLVLCQKDGVEHHNGVSDDTNGDPGVKGTGVLGLGLGDRRWTTWLTQATTAGDESEASKTLQQDGDSTKNVASSSIDATNALQEALEALVLVVSVTSIFNAAFLPAEGRLGRDQGRKDGLVGSWPTRFLVTMQKYMKRAFIRYRARRALLRIDKENANINPINPAEQRQQQQHQQQLGKQGNATQRNSNWHMGRNPLLQVGVGKLLSPLDCNDIIDETHIHGEAWKLWSGGDFGDDDGKRTTLISAMSLAELPETNGLWQRALRKSVANRIADTFGLREHGVILAEVDNIFVCRVETPNREDNKTLETGRIPEGNAAPKGGTTVPTSLGVGNFRRSKSLLAFTVALSPGVPDWAVCLEQRGLCVRPGGQGTGVVFSGKVRHAIGKTRPSSLSQRVPSNGNRENALTEEGVRGGAQSAVFFLRGFATIRDSRVARDVAEWRWGSPLWHLDASWIRDEDILNRVWMGSRADTSSTNEGSNGKRAERKGVRQTTRISEDVDSVQETDGGADSSEKTGSKPSKQQQQQLPCLDRMNSTSAHHYYRQERQGGKKLKVPMRDDRNRPIIDLIPSSPKISSRVSRAARGKKRAEGSEITINAVLRKKSPWNFLKRQCGRQVGRAGLSLEAGFSPRMDAALLELFGGRGGSENDGGVQEGAGGVAREQAGYMRVPVPPIKYVYVDPRYRGLGLGRRLFLKAMCYLAKRGFRFALIVVEDNGSGGLFGFYEEMGFVRADKVLGISRAMIAPIPPSPEILAR